MLAGARRKGADERRQNMEYRMREREEKERRRRNRGKKEQVTLTGGSNALYYL